MSFISIKSIQQNILKSLTNDLESIGMKWNRLTELNKLLVGFRPGELTVFSGKTGTGKTTFASEYSLDLAESGIKTLWGTFEISTVKLSKILLSQYKRKSLHSLHKYQLEQLIEEFSDKIPLQFINTHGEQSFVELFETLERAHSELKVQHVVLDNLQFMVGVHGASMTDKLHSQDKFVGRLRQFVNNSNVHVTLIAHPRKENSSELLTVNSLYGGCKLAQEADNIMLLQTLESQNKKFLQLPGRPGNAWIVKNRHTGTLGTMTLKFNPDSLTFSNTRQQQATKTRNPRKEPPPSESVIVEPGYYPATATSQPQSL